VRLKRRHRVSSLVKGKRNVGTGRTDNAWLLACHKPVHLSHITGRNGYMVQRYGQRRVDPRELSALLLASLSACILITLPLSLWLIGFAYLTSPHPAPPALQNDLLVGLLLMMFAIVPNEAAAPPPAWRDFYSPVGSQTDEVRTRKLHVSGAIGQRRKG
jgi:hypothetical protein